MNRWIQIVIKGSLALFAAVEGWLLWNKYRSHSKPVNLLKDQPHSTKNNTSASDSKAFPYWILGLVLIAIITGEIIGKYGFWFKASLLDLPETEFTGTTYPVKQVPIWTELTDAERRMTFDQIPSHKFMGLPDYDLSSMKAGQVWKPDNEQERNIYVTYPVPNLGNYNLDGTENSGSHPGLDIKIPTGTPIYAMANGVVYKVEHLTTGFGKYVSIAHINIPAPNDSNEKISVVSTYAHLSETKVKAGDRISKGQIIGKSGATGFATAPHLHFQVDKAEAPFLPYWPFSWNDVVAAGYNSYFDGVRYGVGKSNAVRYTVHPFEYIAQYENFTPLSIAESSPREENLVVTDQAEVTLPVAPPTVIEDIRPSAPTSTDSLPQAIPPTPVQDTTSTTEPPASTPPEAITEEVDSETPAQTETVVVTQPAPARATTAYNKALEISFQTDRTYIPGKPEEVIVRINEANLVASSGIEISSTLRDRAEVFPRVLKPSDFENNQATVLVKTESEYPFKLVALVDENETKSDSLRPKVFTDVAIDHPNAIAIRYLKDNNVVKGYNDGTYRSAQTLNRAEALKVILEANKIKVSQSENIFHDIIAGQWFYDYVTTAYQKQIVKGYPDGNFRPGNTVTRAEFLKMAIETKQVPAPDNSTSPYNDVPANLWFTPYFNLNKNHNFIRPENGGNISPNKPISRGEAAQVIYELSKIQLR